MTAIIGCGNSNRTDDGVGIIVAQNLKNNQAIAVRNDIRVFDAGTSGMDVMFQARGCSRLILIDASSTGSVPGSIFTVPGEYLDAEHLPDQSVFSLHGFRWDQAIIAGRQIFKTEFPRDILVYLVEAKTTGFGLELTEPVASAAEKVIDFILELVCSSQVD